MIDVPPHGFGEDALSLRTSAGPAWVVSSIDAIPLWLRGAAFASRCRDFRYYEVLEVSLRGQFDFHYFLMQEEASGEWAVQPFFFVDQDLLAGLPARLRSAATLVRRFWGGFLKLRMMTIGSAASEGDLDHDQSWIAVALHEAIESYRHHSRASLILLKDFPSSYRNALAPFSSNGYQRSPSMPAARLDIDFADFEQYMMAKLSKVFRKNLRRKLRSSQAGPPITLEVLNDASGIIEEIFPLYLQTYQRSDFTFEKLTTEYFCLLGQRMPDRTRFFVWRRDNRIIAFNLCMIHDGNLHDVAIGLEYPLALELSLYFVTWHDVMTWSIENGIKCYHTGPLNYDPKLHLKLSLAPLDLYVRHNWDLINPIFKLALRYLEPTRHDPVLRQFHNAAELYQ